MVVIWSNDKEKKRTKSLHYQFECGSLSFYNAGVST